MGKGGAPGINDGVAPTTAVELMACVGWDGAPATIEDNGTAVGLVASSEKETVVRFNEVDVVLLPLTDDKLPELVGELAEDPAVLVNDEVGAGVVLSEDA